MKTKLKICIFTIIILLILQPYNVYASIIKYDTSTNGVKTYYVSNHTENILVLNLIKARKESESKIVYSGEMALNEYEYLEDVSDYDDISQNIINNTGYGIGVDYSDSMTTKSKTKDSITISYYSYYRETPEETEYVYSKIRQAIKDSIVNLNTDYEKAYWAYHWIADNMYYDKTLQNFTPYEGLSGNGTVCMGYATLYCALLNELGLDVRYVSGNVHDNGSHAWNIVKINNEWYCVDPTWGDSIYGDKYFLKTVDTFASYDYGCHESDLYNYYVDAGEKFAENDFDESTTTTSLSDISPSVYNVEMDVLKINILSVGEKYKFMISNPDNVQLTFISSDSSVASVSKNGTIVGKSKGTVAITVYNSDLKISQTCEITVK